ncbi:hypothetical protein DRW07_05315 [Alteromonas sediminis]|uniref:Uncharacterized protein n=1 Tax=Alteromonas sediminis TaxID=2259342 RepID=A0A3N5Z878_9ALTE|nr:hypothetical protein [Alteromonas sediminis]RPJ66964.1 hypothetical protein DRW07_05315 [Alteromonas sediminis]
MLRNLKESILLLIYALVMIFVNVLLSRGLLSIFTDIGKGMEIAIIGIVILLVVALFTEVGKRLALFSRVKKD